MKYGSIVAIVVAAIISSVVTGALIESKEAEVITVEKITNRNWIPTPCIEVIYMDQNVKANIRDEIVMGGTAKIIAGEDEYFNLKLEQCMKEHEKETEYINESIMEGTTHEG